MKQRHILLVQPQMAALDGHEHTQIKAVKWLLPDCRLSVLTRRGFGLSGQIGDLNILQVFPASVRRRPKTPAPDDGFVDALRNAIVSLEAGSSDLILVPSAGPYEIEVLLRFFEHDATGESPPAKLRILSDDVLARFDAEFLARLRRVCTTGRVTLHAETAELSGHMANHYQLPVSGPLNLPCTILPGDPDTQTTPRAPGEEIKVGVLGRQRSEKGSYRIPEIMRHLRDLTAGLSDGTKICIVYQAVKTKRLRRIALELKTRLRAHKNRDIRIEFLDSGMLEKQFRQLVLEMDILLLPYDTQRYQYSGSGIIMDGILGLKPIVHSRGMAMRELLLHGNAEAAATNREFAEKLLRVATELPRYQESAKDAAMHLQQLFKQSVQSLTD